MGSRASAWVVVGIAALGLAIRLAEAHQGLAGDELIALSDVQGRSIGGLLDQLRTGVENSPPLYFLLGWASLKVGSDPALLRLPSVALGTATIPLVYLVGRRTVGRWAGVVGAGFQHAAT